MPKITTKHHATAQPTNGVKKKTKSSAKSVRAATDNAAHKALRPDAPALLPESIVRVRRVLDAHGHFAGMLRVSTRDSHGAVHHDLFDLVAKFHGSTDLATLCYRRAWLDNVTPKTLSVLAETLRKAATTSVRLLHGHGLHEPLVGGKRFQCLVWRGQPHWVGDVPKRRFAVTPNLEPLPVARGTLGNWNKRIGTHLAGNPMMLVAVCAGLAAPIVALLGLQPVSLILVGGSSTGKTTVQAVVQSMLQPGNDIASASGSESGLRKVLLQCRDHPALLQDLRQVDDVQMLYRLLFDLGNNASRVTSTADQKLNATASLRCSLIASNERSLADMTRGKRVSLDEGLSARVFELFVDGPHGAFHQLPKGVTAAEFADGLKASSKTCYGAVWDAWMTALADNEGKFRGWHEKYFQRLHGRLMKQVDAGNAVTHRLVLGMVAWAFAGCVAADFGVLPITKKQVVDAFKEVLRAHAQRHRHGLSATGEEVIAHVRDLLDRNGRRFFELRDDNAGEQSGEFGYWREVNGEKQFLMLPGGFEQHVSNKFGRQHAVAALSESGYLISDKQGDQKLVRMSPGRRKRFYVIRDSIRYDAR